MNTLSITSMLGALNSKFILLVVIIFFLFHSRKNSYSRMSEGIEEFKSSTLERINFMSPYRDINAKKIYTHQYDSLEKIPRLFTNFKYSLEYKLGSELQKIFKIKNQESPGLFQNLTRSTDSNFSQDVFLTSETDFYRLIEKNPSLKDKIGFVTAFYYQHFLLFTKGSFPIRKMTDLKKYSDMDVLPSNLNLKSDVIKIGIPHSGTNSYQDAIYIFNSMGLNITQEYKNLKFIFDDEKKLHSRLKLTSGEDMIHCLYLTTSIRHPYLIEYLQSNQINVITTESVNINVLKSNYGGNYLFKNRIPKNNFSPIIKKKNIYQDVPDYSLSTRLINNDSETLIIGGSYLNLLSTRVILVAPLTLSSDYVNFLLRNIYASINILKKTLQDYLFNKVLRNFLTRYLDPYEMSYVNSKFKYHPGAYQFYQEMQFISDASNIKENMIAQTK